MDGVAGDQISNNFLFSIYLMNYLLSIEFCKLSILAVGLRTTCLLIIEPKPQRYVYYPLFYIHSASICQYITYLFSNFCCIYIYKSKLAKRLANRIETPRLD